MEDKKTNKKTRGIIIAAMVLLLIAIMCFCGVTFARYITKSSVPTQQATVAKWGFVVSANAENLFGKGYNQGEIVAKPDESGAVVDVKAATSTVAPGTKGEMTFGVTGSAEVLAQLKMTVKADTLKDISLTQGGDVYTPIKWKLEKGTDGTTYGTEVAKGTLSEIVNKVNEINSTIKIGESVSDYYKLSWEWVFDTDADSEDDDVKDTILGYAAKATSAEQTFGNYKVSAKATNGTVTVIDTKGTTETTDDVTYTAIIDINFDLSIIVMQIQTPTTGA